MKNFETPQPWIHRGLYDNKLVFENTIPAFDSAQKVNAFIGIELDVFYIDSLDDFIISHDWPNRYQLPLLKLVDVFKRYDTSFNYWLDLKNLTQENQSKISSRMKTIIGTVNSNLTPRIYIESGNAKPLGFLADEGLNSIYWIQYNRTNFLKKWLKKNWIKAQFIRYDFKGGTIGASMVDKDFKKSFKALPKFLFHIYSPQLYFQTAGQPNVAVTLLDYIPSANEK